MNVDIIPLGTASAIPTRDRSPSALALERKGRLLLFDCGEGTQMRLLEAGLKPTRIDAVFITHLHGDHYFGLPGLLSTLSLMERSDPMTIIAPLGLRRAMQELPGLELEWTSFDIAFMELDDALRREEVYKTEEFWVEARPIQHRTFAAGFRFEEVPKPGHLDVDRARELGVVEYEHYRALKQGQSVTVAGGHVVQPDDVIGPDVPGRSFAYVTDTRPCENGRTLARNADLVYHEATFGAALASRAKETGHSTATEAAQVVRDAGAARLLLGHFSARYPDPSVLLTEAQAVFKNTELAQELKRYSL